MANMKKHRVAPTVAYIKSLRIATWGGFKHALHRAGVLPTPVADVPVQWQQAFKKTFRGGA
jgi:hypothetical protein